MIGTVDLPSLSRQPQRLTVSFTLSFGSCARVLPEVRGTSLRNFAPRDAQRLEPWNEALMASDSQNALFTNAPAVPNRRSLGFVADEQPKTFPNWDLHFGVVCDD